MKSLPKIITKIFLTIIIFCNLFFVFGVGFTYAADKNINDECAPGVDKCLKGTCIQDTATAYHCLIAFKPQVEIPGIDSKLIQPKNSTRALGEYIKGFYDYAVGITAIVATVVLMIGGFQWIIAGGSGEKIGEAKAWITAALSGLVLALSSYMLLNLVNPDLVNFTVKEIKPIEVTLKGCCESTESGGTQRAYGSNSSECKNSHGVFYENYSADTQGKNCVTGGCCILHNENFWREWYDCYPNVVELNCLTKNFYIDSKVDEILDINFDDSNNGKCNSTLNLYTYCHIK